MQHARIVDIVLEDTIAAAFPGGDDDDDDDGRGGPGVLQLLSYLQAHAACSDGRDHSG